MAELKEQIIKHGITINKKHGTNQGDVCVTYGRDGVNSTYLNEEYFINDDTYSGEYLRIVCVKSGWYSCLTKRSAGFSSNYFRILKNNTVIYNSLTSGSWFSQKFESGDTIEFEANLTSLSLLASIFFLSE